jgi:spermidine synthase
MKNTSNQPHPRPTLFVFYLILTAMVCGALVMVVEVLGSRVLGPFFGVSLFVWTSLITVTLVALAAGYAAGGIAADKKDSPRYLFGIILVAGFLVLAIPLTKGLVLKMCQPLGLRLGALASSLLLFGPSLFLLGCVSPYIVKIAAREVRTIGRTVGLFYALSTLGSFLGTIVTGFVLIAYLGVDRIFQVAGILLICLALIYFVFFQRRGSALLILSLPLFLLQTGSPAVKTMANGTLATRVYSKDSFYGNLKVVDYSSGSNHTRELIIDGLIQGGINMANNQSIYEYSYFMEFLPYGIHPEGRNCLVIGLGAGVVPQWYEARGIRTDVVDIDPEVVRIARDYFGFKLSGDIIVSDARYYLIHADKQYDYVILDVFNGDTTPGHVLSREALQLIKQRMTPKGVLAVNVVGSLKENNFITASIVKTLRTVFMTVELYPTFSPAEGSWGNIALIAYGYPPVPFNAALTKTFAVDVFAREGVDRLLGLKFDLPAQTAAIILSDDYNPVDFYDSWVKENVRKRILENTDWDILI